MPKVHILAAGVALLILTTALGLTPPTATATSIKQVVTPAWKTYHNTAHGFSIQYPASFTLEPVNNLLKGFAIVGFTHSTGIFSIHRPQASQIGVTIGTADSSGYFQTEGPDIKVTPTTINGVQFQKGDFGDNAMGGERGGGTDYWISRNGSYFVIETSIHYSEFQFNPQYGDRDFTPIDI